MKDVKMDMMGKLGDVDAMCVTTNGFVTRKGNAVMGRGTARLFADRFPKFPYIYGNILSLYELGVMPVMLFEKTTILAFPVKWDSDTSDGNNVVKHQEGKFQEGSFVPGWALKADLELIKRSAEQLVALTEVFDWREVWLPRPGCGAGELSWDEVKPALAKILRGDRYVCCHIN